MVLLAVGLAGSAYTAWAVWRLCALLIRSTNAVGIIVDPQPHPTIRFLDSAGHAIDFVQNGFISRPAGASVPVMYDVANPAGTAQAATFWTTWGTALWMLPTGIVFLVGASHEGITKWRRR